MNNDTANPSTVIPAQAGTHGSTGLNLGQLSDGTVGPGLRRDDGKGMTRNARRILVVGAILGLTSVMLGAGMDHAAPEWGAQHRVQTALHYHQLYAPLIVVLGLALTSPHLTAAQRRGLQASAWLFTAGIILFAGALYLAGVMPVLVYLTPVGGMLLMAGWVALGMAFLRCRLS